MRTVNFILWPSPVLVRILNDIAGTVECEPFDGDGGAGDTAAQQYSGCNGRLLAGFQLRGFGFFS